LGTSKDGDDGADDGLATSDHCEDHNGRKEYFVHPDQLMISGEEIKLLPNSVIT
jgi:hypothetical protein